MFLGYLDRRVTAITARDEPAIREPRSAAVCVYGDGELVWSDVIR